jgi:TolB-like protein
MLGTRGSRRASSAQPSPTRVRPRRISPSCSNDPSQDYFADGVTENLTTELSRIAGTFVIARNTAFVYKGKNVNTRQIGSELGVRYVLEGSVQRDHDRVRVNAQLIDAESGSQIWAESFDKPLTDLFAVQDEIVASLGSQLGTQLAIAEGRRAERTSDPIPWIFPFKVLPRSTRD